MPNVVEEGQFLKADFFDNTGGVNISDSPFRMLDTQATNGRNWEYALTGGIRKRLGHTKINTNADTALRTTGVSQYIATDGTKTVIRAADRKIQNFNTGTPSFTNLSEDTVSAGTDFLATSNTQQVVWSQFLSNNQPVLWASGGGLSNLYGIYSSTKVTANGAAKPTGGIGLTAVAGANLPDGTYWYAVTLVKASTGVESNADVDKSVTVSAGNNKVTIDLTTLTSLDTTKYTSIKIYRSAVSGVSGFTTGILVATVASSTTSYTDATSGATTSTVTVPREGNTTDNATLSRTLTLSQPAATLAPKVIATWKRRLVTAVGGYLYISDINKPESWPISNYFQVPSAGDITGLAVITYATATSSLFDELLVVFKEKEVWVVTGSSLADWAIKFIDTVGAVNQSVIVNANGYIGWMDYQGFYIWNGSGKPIYISRPIEPLFQASADLDKTKFNLAWGVYNKKQRQITWYLSHLIYGEQKFGISLDLRLTLPQTKTDLLGNIMDGVFVFDVLTFPLYSCASMLQSSTYEEVLISGDASGFTYFVENDITENGGGIDFQYETKYLDLGMIGVTKRFAKVILWVEDSTTANIRLDWWTRYKSGANDSSSMSRPNSNSVTESLWDLASWDAAYWDNTFKAYNPVVFNLQSGTGVGGGVEGECIKLKFSNSNASAPVTIAGFTILFSKQGMRL